MLYSIAPGVNVRSLVTVQDEKRIKNRAYNIATLVDDYSSPKISKMLGDHLESLVKAEQRAQQFDIKGVHTNEYKSAKWTESDHTLDIIAECRNGKLAIRVEVKNTLELITQKEIDIKIKICKYLGIVPVFAVRWNKPYVDHINKQGGFCWMFKTQIYPLGQEDLVKRLYSKLSELNRTDSKGNPLMFPVSVRTELPPKSIQIFQKWQSTQK